MNDTCWICGKLKGQPPERCNGHYDIPNDTDMREECEAILNPKIKTGWIYHPPTELEKRLARAHLELLDYTKDLLRCTAGHIHNQPYGKPCPMCERDELRSQKIRCPLSYSKCPGTWTPGERQKLLDANALLEGLLAERKDAAQQYMKQRDELASQKAAIESELEQSRIQHAGCLSAAEGCVGDNPPKQGEWAWSPAFQAVLELRQQKAALESKVEEHRERHEHWAAQYTIVKAEKAALESQLAEARKDLGMLWHYVACPYVTCDTCTRNENHIKRIHEAIDIDAAGALRAKPEEVSPQGEGTQNPLTSLRD